MINTYMESTLTQESSLQFLAGGGECGRMIRSYDWSATSLGHPSGWPASLKTCVRIILTSRQPMFVWWGADLINIHNDPYRDILGGKHPWALGQPANEIWKEIWTQIAPRVDSAINENEGTYDEALLLIMERNGYPEETYYTFSYSPVPGEDGLPAGIICANTDDTERIVSERQLRTLKDLGKAYTGAISDGKIYENTIAVLEQNPHDFPFAAIYRADNDTLTLAAKTANLPDELTPEIMRSAAKTIWPLKEVMTEKRERLLDVTGLNLPCGVWKYPPRQVLLTPIANTGQVKPYGVLIVGLNQYRLFDERYGSFFGLLTDQIATGITSVRAYEEEKRRVAALMEIDKAKTVFFNNVSHEFRTPLTLMLGPVEELLRQQDDTMPQVFRDNTQAIHRNAQRLLKLVNSLLEFSRIEAGRVQASYKPVNISALTEDLASGFRSIIEKAGLFFEVDCAPVSKPVYIDAGMWEKIVLNLLSNAFKYTLTGGIKLTLKQDRNDAVLTVEDTGVGIPAHELPHMFERFHRIHGSEGRTHEGTGIGLSLIHELVKLHSGTISITSEVGEGSLFTVKIPTGKAHLASEQVSEDTFVQAISSLSGVFINEAASLLADGEEDRPATPANPVLLDENLTEKSTRILVADDNADMRAYLQRLLDPYYTISVASNGMEALERISTFKPNLVVSDIMMPVMDGKEFLEMIRSDFHMFRLPVILLSARAGEEARIEGLEAGADDYLVKPFSARELLSKVRSHVNIARARTHTEELLRQLFANAPVAIGIMRGPRLIVELANPLLLEIWGRDIEEVIDKPLMTAIPELEGQGSDLLLREVMDTGQRFVSNEHEVSIIRKSTLQKISVTFIYEPLREANGSISGVIVLAHEITDLVNARQTAQRNAEELRHLVAQRDEFLSIASHELKTPVTSMKAALQMLDRIALPDSQAEGFIKMATRQVNRLAALISDLLDVSSLQAGKMKFYFEKFKLSDLMKDVIEQHQQSQNHHQIVFECSCTGFLNADRNRLEQVVSNLVSNAVKYSPDADKIVIKCGKEGEHIKVSVADFGIGIPEEMKDRVFERFFRVEESGQSFSGLGLGLYISSEIIKRHNGAIGVHSNSPQGSVFWFSLPAEN